MKKTNKKIKILLFIAVLLFFSLYIKADTPRATEQITPVLNRAYLENCLRIINSAKKYILIAHFYFKEDAITEKIETALKNAPKRNVKVRIILDSSIPENSFILKKFSSCGAETKLTSPKKKLHAKLIIVDGHYTLLGSTNFSEKSIDENNEANILIYNSAVSKVYEKYFESLWNDEKVFRNTGLLALGAKQRTLPVLGKDYLSRALGLINNSRRNIGVILYMAHFTPSYYSSKPNRLLRALIEAKRNGTRVRVIFEKSDHDEKLNEMNRTAFDYLTENKIEVKYDSLKTITHAKLLLCDNAAILGSTNWVISGLGTNKEADVLVRDPQAVNKYWKYFEGLWKEY